MREGGKPALRQWKSRPRLRRDWDRRLSDWLAKAFVEPHRFGEHDCLLAPIAAVEAQTGRDFAAGHRGRWKSRTGARRYLRSLGFNSLEEVLDSLLDPVPPAFAQRGDLVMFDGVPGVVIGGEALFWHDGLEVPARVPRARWSKAWSVGRLSAEAARLTAALPSPRSAEADSPQVAGMFPEHAEPAPRPASGRG